MPKSPVKMKSKSKISNHVIILLDRSGSMDPHRDKVLSTVREQLQTHSTKSRELEQDTKVTLLTFSDVLDAPVVDAQDAREITTIQDNTYVPNGSTALNDSIGIVLNRFSPGWNKDKDTSYLVVIVTDGEENASKEYNTQKVKDLILKAQATDHWSFVFFCPSYAESMIATNYGIPAGNIKGWAQTVQGFVDFKWQINNVMTDNYYGVRSMGITASNSLMAEPNTGSPTGNSNV